MPFLLLFFSIFFSVLYNDCQKKKKDKKMSKRDQKNITKIVIITVSNFFFFFKGSRKIGLRKNINITTLDYLIFKIILQNLYVNIIIIYMYLS